MIDCFFMRMINNMSIFYRNKFDSIYKIETYLIKQSKSLILGLEL